MSIQVSRYVGRTSAASTDPARFVVPAGVGYYNVMTYRTTDAVTRNSGTIPCPLLNLPGQLYAPSNSASADIEFYDNTNSLQWGVACTDVKGVATNSAGYAIDEANSTIIGCVTSGSTERDLTYYTITGSTGTITAASTQTAALTEAEATSLQTAIDNDGIFCDYDTTYFDIYFVDSSEIKKVSITKSTGAVTVGTLGFRSAAQSTFYPDSITYVSADETVAALFEIQSTSLDMHIHIAYKSSATGQFQHASVRFHPDQLGLFGAYGDNGTNKVNVWRTGNYCYLGRYERDASMDFRGNRAYARSDMDAWLLSLMKV